MSTVKILHFTVYSTVKKCSFYAEFPKEVILKTHFYAEGSEIIF
jgi:hypothetical protein